MRLKVISCFILTGFIFNNVYCFESMLPLNMVLNIKILEEQGTITYNEYEWAMPKKITLPGGTVKIFEYDPLMQVKGIMALTVNRINTGMGFSVMKRFP